MHPNNKANTEEIEEGARRLLWGMGYDIEGPHLVGTPERVARALVELTSPTEFEFTTFPNDGTDQMVVVKDIPFYSLCAHHMLPFVGVAHVSYIPSESLCGLSKLARTVEYFSKGLCIQEEITTNIADYIVERLQPLGVAVVLEATHMCMTMRGVQKPGAKTTTAAMRGVFLDNDEGARQEFYDIIR